MKKNISHLLKPNYYDSFSCIGPSCTDNCCHTWQLDMDKHHYFQYYNFKNPEFHSHFCQSVSVLENRTDSHYAAIHLDENGRCSFQDTDGGCRIYRIMGADFLCNTCATYPRRRLQFFSDTWELSLSLSCMEAARLCLFDCGPISFSFETIKAAQVQQLEQIPLTGIGKQGKVELPLPLTAPLRQASLELIQCRQYSLQERILAIGILMQRADHMIFSGSGQQLPAFINQFLLSVKKGQFHGVFQSLNYEQSLHLAALKLPLSHLLVGFRTPVLKKLIEQILPHCNMDPNTGEYQTTEETLDYIWTLMQKYTDVYFSNFNQALENFFTNYLFSNLFPFFYRSEGLSFEQHGMMLAEQYAILRMLFALFAQTDQEAGKNQFLQAAVALSRSSQHTDFGPDMLRLANTVDVKRFAHTTYLLR